MLKKYKQKDKYEINPYKIFYRENICLFDLNTKVMMFLYVFLEYEYIINSSEQTWPPPASNLFSFFKTVFYPQFSLSLACKMKGFIVVDRINDIQFLDTDREFSKHINEQAKESGLLPVSWLYKGGSWLPGFKF